MALFLPSGDKHQHRLLKTPAAASSPAGGDPSSLPEVSPF